MKPILLLIVVSSLFAQQQIHLIPPPGVAVPDADQRQIKAGLARLGARIEALKSNPNIADVQIFRAIPSCSISMEDIAMPAPSPARWTSSKR